MDKVSVIVPVFNEKEEYLNQSIKSIINQTYTNIEIIIVDDGSRDDVAKVCDSFLSDKRICVYHKKNEGVSVARNFGISKSSGKWITFVDSDDWLEEDAIEKLHNCVDKCSFVISRYYSDNVKKVDSNEYDRLYDNITIFRAMFYQKDFLSAILESCWAKLYLKEIIESNELKFPKFVKKGEDMLFNMQYLKHIDNVYLLDSYTYHYRVNLQSVTRRYDKSFLNVNQELLLKSYDYFVENYEDQLDCYYFMAIRHLHRGCQRYIFNGKSEIKYSDRVKILEEEVNKPIYSIAIKNIKLSKLGIFRKVLVSLIRMKLYSLAGLIYIKQLNSK